MDVSVIMINYNTYELTKDALNSLFTHTVGLKYEIILVDNQSPDGSGDRLADEFGNRIKYIQSGGNLGTSKGFNLGLKNASGKYVLWLNTDILLRDNFIGTLFSFMEQHPDCGVCGGNLLGFDGKPAHSYSKSFLSAKTLRKDRSFILKIIRTIFKKAFSFDYNYTGAPMEVSQIVGADMMVRRELFDEVGLFEEAIFMYCEETEFQYRVRKYTSYRIFSVPEAVMYHLEGGSFQKKSKVSAAAYERRYRAVITGESTFLYKHFGQAEVMKYLRVEKRTGFKYSIISFFLGNRDKYAEFSARRKLAKQWIANFHDFIASLGILTDQ